MKRVVVTGTFDGIHPGHEFFLREAKKLGDWLGVVVALDETVEKIKGHVPEKSQRIRQIEVESLRIADIVTLGYPDDKYQIIEELHPDIIALGYDQRAFTKDLQESLQARGLQVEIVRISAFHPEKYKSSILKKNKTTACVSRETPTVV